MKIETCIDSLVSYAMNCGLAEPDDHVVLTNRILDLLRKDDYEPSDEPQSEDLEEILAGILDYAVEKGLCDDGISLIPCWMMTVSAPSVGTSWAKRCSPERP